MPDTRCPSLRVSKLTGSLNEALLNSFKPEALVCPSSSVGESQCCFRCLCPTDAEGTYMGMWGVMLLVEACLFLPIQRTLGRLFK